VKVHKDAVAGVEGGDQSTESAGKRFGEVICKKGLEQRLIFMLGADLNS
jgi:hypothetical protein